MSKLREHLNAEVFPVSLPKSIKPLIECMDVCSSIDNSRYDEQYVVDVRIRVATTMTREILQDKPELRERAIEDMKRDIINQIFGEFKRPLYKLRTAVYRNDEVTAIKLLDDLLVQMYD